MAAPALTGLAPQEPRRRSAFATSVQPLRPYVTGGLAACFASACIHPIDLVKVRLQLVGEGSRAAARPGALSVATAVVREGGISSLYTGLSAALTRQATYGTARIGLHTVFSRKLAEQQGDGQPIPLWKKFCSGFVSGAIASAIGNPFDVSLVRMQADGLKPEAERRGYTGVVNAVTRITREEGFSALYHGYPPTLFRAIAMNVGMMVSYDQIKEGAVALNGGTDNLKTQLLSAAGAGFVCALMSLPPDMLKTRLQNMKPDAATGELPYRGLLDCGVKVLRNEGPLAFWRGFGAYYTRCAPHAMIILMAREQLVQAWDAAFPSDS